MGINFSTGRKLGALDRFFWLNDQNRSNHFSIAAEIRGNLAPTIVRAALLDLAKNLPHASGRISVDADGDARFAPSFEQVDLRIVCGEPIEIGSALAGEVGKRFYADRGPLVRAVLL